MSDSPFPGPPIDPVQQATLDPLPSARGYWIGGAIMVIGAAVAVVLFVQGLFGFVGKIGELDRIAVPGEDTVELGEGEWVVYWEPVGDSAILAETLGDFDLTIEPVGSGEGTRDDVLIAPRGANETYTDGSYSGYSIADFRIEEAGDYEIRVEFDSLGAGAPGSIYPRAGSIAIGRPLFSGLLARLGIGALIGGLSFVVGLVLLIVTGVRRGKAKRARFPRSGYRPGYGAPGAYPPSGYAAAPAYPPPTGAPAPSPGGWPPPAPPPAPPAAPPPAGGTPEPPASPIS